MGRKGITLIELVVVIVVTMLLVAVLTPGLNKSRQLAVRLLCETNLRGIGSAMAAYAGDNDGDFPRAGGPDATWSSMGHLTNAWKKAGVTPRHVFGIPPKATITSCLWLLVRGTGTGLDWYATPKQFVCKGDRYAFTFGISKLCKMGRPPNIFVCWDFGGDKDLYPGDCCSYSYNMPFVMDEFRPDRNPTVLINFAIDQLSSEASPVCADRNPYLDLNVNIDPLTHGGNSAAHWWRGQNVLYKDLHVDFADDPCVGIESDNIYTFGGDVDTGGGDPVGTPPSGPGQITSGEHQQGEKDAFLVSETQSP